MTPRQIIQQISERRHLENIKVTKAYLEDNKSNNVCGNSLGLVNRREYEANNQIKQSKLEDILTHRGEQQSIPWTCVQAKLGMSMHQTRSEYVQGNGILSKSRDVASPTRFYDHDKERQTKPPGISISTLYKTFRNANEENRRAKSQRMKVVPKPRRVERANSWSENDHFDSKLSNIRGMAKQIHAKSIVLEMEPEKGNTERITNDKFIRNFTRHSQELQHQKVLKNDRIRNKGMVRIDQSNKQMRLHVYVPTADTNS